MVIVRMSATRLAVLVAVSSLPRPTIRAVAAATGLAYSTAYYHLSLLRRAGWIAWEDGRDGTLRSHYTAHRPLETRP